MNRIILTILAIVLFALGSASAQDITTANLSWEIKRTDYIGTGMFDEPGGTLVSYGNTRVEWYKTDGILKQAFTVRETNGVWANVATNGTILYEAESEDKVCTLTFIRDGAALRATLVILPDNGQPAIYEFTLQNFTTL